MTVLLGVIFLFVCVFGIFFWHGGNPDVLIQALPAEFGTIFGAGIAGLVIAGSIRNFHYFSNLSKIILGPYWEKKDYIDAVVLLNKLLKIWKTSGAAAIETHIEDPKSSEFFSDYPKLSSNERLINFITDNMRVLVNSGNSLNGYHFEDLINKNIKLHAKEEFQVVDSLKHLAGSLPALGIVAAVLGIVKTMASIDQPPAVLGSLIGGALLGTFLGIFLAYGIVEPCAIRLKEITEKDENIFHLIREIFVSNAHGLPQIVMLEAARNSISPENQPTFDELFESLHG